MFNSQINKLISISNQHPKQGSEEWLTLRENFVTGTKVAKARSIRKFGKRLALTLPGHRFNGNFYTEHGKYYESIAKQMYETTFGDFVVDLNFIHHPRHPNKGCSPDGFSVVHNCLIEIKCPYNADLISGKIKTEHYNQIQYSLSILAAWGIKTYCKYVVFDHKTLNVTVLDVEYNPDFWPEMDLDVNEYMKCQKANSSFLQRLLN